MKKIISLLLTLILMLTFSLAMFGCKKDDEENKPPIIDVPDEPDVPEEPEEPEKPDVDLSRGYEYKKTSPAKFQFTSSDAEFDTFINEYTERHLRYGENAINSLKLGDGNSIWKEWETMSTMFMSTAGIGYDPKSKIKSWVSSITQDDFGYVWMDNGTNSTSWGQGWEFPNSSHSGGNNYEFTFEDVNDKEDWTGKSDNGATEKIVGGALSVKATDMRSVTFATNESIGTIAKTFHSPFVEINLKVDEADKLSTDKISGITLKWKTKSGGTYIVTQKDFCITPIGDQFPSTNSLVFPMYANANWSNNQEVVGLEIKVDFKSNFTGEIGLNSVNLTYDSRQINNNGVFIVAAANYFEYTQDLDFLKDNIVKIRKAMQFYLTYCDGNNGLVSTKNFTGHDGSTNYDYITSKLPVRDRPGLGSGIGDGYWDCLSYPQVSSYCNNLFYQALQKLGYLESALADAKLTVTAPATVKKANMSGSESYSLNVSSLKALEEKCKTEYNKLFWDEDLGRYHLGINSDKQVVDYGFTLYNQEAIQYGLANAEQAKSIMSWINGERNISTDDSKGKNIYFYDFAPRWTTKNNQYQFWWRFDGANGANYKWLYQVQNGGAAIHQAYYDLTASALTDGIDNSFSKFRRIEKWYNKVKGAKGKGSNFYSAHYNKLSSTDARYKLQGSAGAGAVGLDSEFLEAAILYASIPDIYFGLGSTKLNTLNIKPNIPSELSYWKMENLTFGNLIYDLSIGKNFVQINSIRTDSAIKQGGALKLKITLDKPAGNFEVRQHSTILTAGTDYVVEGDKVVITVPFKNGRVQILEK